MKEYDNQLLFLAYANALLDDGRDELADAVRAATLARKFPSRWKRGSATTLGCPPTRDARGCRSTFSSC
jgi:hypothetical protein